MAIEARRGCGFRKIGGLYLIGVGMVVGCDRLPYNLEVCPTCSSGLKFSRGWTWLDDKAFFQKNCKHLKDKEIPCHKHKCEICYSNELGKVGLLWIGKKFYSPESFVKEAQEMKVCKRISQIPKGLELGETVVLLAHIEAGEKEVEDKNTLTGKTTIKVPAIMYVFKPQKVEQIVTEKQSKNKGFMESLEKRGITPVVVPDNDPDHKGTVYDKQKDKKWKKLQRKLQRKEKEKAVA